MSLMRNLLLRAVVLAIGCAPGLAGQSLQERIDGAKRRVYPALVNISVVTRTFSGGRAVRQPSSGSGTIISPAGHVITNYHVVQDAQRITCTLPSGEEIPADILADDPAIDMSMLQLRMGEREDPSRSLPFATIGDSSRLKVGDHVLAVGNPLGLASSMTLGIVSNTERVFTDFLGNTVEDLDIGARSTGRFTRWIQHDALILPGNSGGPLVSLDGEIVGMNTRGGNGVSFATPAALLRKSIGQILSYGEVRRGWIGVELQPVGRIGEREGALVAAVRRESPAAEAGVRPGDLLLAIGETPVSCRFIEELPLAYGIIADRLPGQKTTLSLRRDGKTLTRPVTIDLRRPALTDVVELRVAGATARDLTKTLALERRLEVREGVLLTGVRAGLPFEQAKPPLRAGDILVAFDGEAIGRTEDLVKALAGELTGREVGVRIRRGDQDLVSVVSFEAPPAPMSGARIERAWLGIETQVMTPPVARAVGMEEQCGFRVTRVYAGTEAAKAGLRPGDVLVRAGDEALTASRDQDARDLVNLIEDEYRVGEELALRVLRGEEVLDLKVELETSPAAVRAPARARSETLEFRVRDLRFEDRVRNRWAPERTGVLVTEVTSGGWAAMAGLRVGDLLVRMNGAPLATCADFEKRVAALESEHPRHVRLFVHRGNTTTFVVIQPEWK
jgi:serine protease Do